MNNRVRITYHARPFQNRSCEWSGGCGKRPTKEVWSSMNDRAGVYCAAHAKRRVDMLNDRA